MNIKYATISKARPVGRVRARRVGACIHAGDAVTIAHVGDSRCYFSYRPEVAVPDIVQFELKAGDRILLCSDGLYKSMAPNILLARMMDDKPLADILDVYEFMCEKQSDDNYTAVLI